RPRARPADPVHLRVPRGASPAPVRFRPRRWHGIRLSRGLLSESLNHRTAISVIHVIRAEPLSMVAHASYDHGSPDGQKRPAGFSKEVAPQEPPRQADPSV